jgi:hypothetical protein
MSQFREHFGELPGFCKSFCATEATPSGRETEVPKGRLLSPALSSIAVEEREKKRFVQK